MGEEIAPGREKENAEVAAFGVELESQGSLCVRTAWRRC